MESAERIRTTAPTKCFIVMIGERFVDRVSEILFGVETLTSGLSARPKIFIVEKEIASFDEKSLFMVNI